MTAHLYTGDCLTLMENILPPRSAACVLTDIPYGEVNERDTREGGLRVFKKGAADVATFSVDDFMAQVCRIAAGTVYVWCGVMQVSEIMRALRRDGFLVPRLGVWEKTNPSPANAQHFYVSGLEYCVLAKRPGSYYDGKYAKPAWHGPIVPSSRRRHPTEKPVWLMREQLVKVVRPGDLVVDPCMGSCPVGEAALALGCDFWGADIDPAWVRVSAERLGLTDAEVAA